MLLNRVHPPGRREIDPKPVIVPGTAGIGSKLTDGTIPLHFSLGGPTEEHGMPIHADLGRSKVNQA